MNSLLVPRPTIHQLLSASVALLASASVLLAQGSLTPPGAPAATMKTLDQVEPRAPIPGGASAFNITAPGSYYLTGNITVPNGHGIVIDASDVTLDLMGHTIATNATGTGDGVQVSIGHERVTILNGIARGFTNGFSATFASASRLEKLHATGCTHIGVDGGPGGVLIDCEVTQMVGAVNISAVGIHAGDGSTVSRCTVYNSVCNSGLKAGFASVITNCSVFSNTVAKGINADTGSTVAFCAARSNSHSASSSFGIEVGDKCNVLGCTSSDNGSNNGSPNGSTGGGIHALTGAVVKDCIVAGNRGDGIQVATSCLVANNHCDGNGNSGDGAGIHATADANRIDGNSVIDNDRGIDVDGIRNLVVRNTASSNSNLNYVIVTGNKVGVISSVPTSLDIAGDTDADAAGVGTTNPWANLSY
jgi:parallel beta-helix repeat protein